MERGRVLLAGIAIWVATALTACAQSEETTVCDQAVERFKACKFDVSGDKNVNCTGSVECTSKCAVAAPAGEAGCQEMKLPVDNAYNRCIKACAGGGT